MSYGLYDADLPYYPIPFYNLELMKISSYYKHKREIVGLSPNFSPNRYNHFIVRQDFYNPNVIFPKSVNVEYGGRAFDGKNYKSLPLEIEAMKPDISLYGRVKTSRQKKYKSAISTMKRAEHIRLSLDGKSVWNDYEKQLRHDSNVYGIIFHDYDLNKIEGAAELIKTELSNWIPYALGRRVGAKFPIQVNTEDDLYKWLTIYPMGAYYSLQYNGLINESYISNLIEIEEEYKTLKQTSINISDTFTYEELINGGIRRIFHNIINLRTQNLIFPLIYNEALLIDNDWKMVMKLIARYNEHLVKNRTKIHYRKYVEPYETLFSYYKNIIKTNAVREPIFNKELVMSIFQFVRENDYELFKDFYEYRGEEVRK